jgi:hypothetical protein
VLNRSSGMSLFWKSEEQKQKNCELSTHVNGVYSRHIKLKHAIENFPENISGRNDSTDKKEMFLILKRKKIILKF